jgi:hypothetical protein
MDDSTLSGRNRGRRFAGWDAETALRKYERDVPPSPQGLVFWYAGRKHVLGAVRGASPKKMEQYAVWDRVREGKPIATYPPTPDGWDIAVQAFLEMESRPIDLIGWISPAIYLGGYGTELAPKTLYVVEFTHTQLRITNHPMHTVSATMELAELTDFEIGGRGLVTKGGGVIGGGFDVQGALEGMAIAGVLNSLTTTSSIETVIRIQARKAELFFFNSKKTPDQLRIDLSEVLGRIRSAQESPCLPIEKAPGRSIFLGRDSDQMAPGRAR